MSDLKINTYYGAALPQGAQGAQQLNPAAVPVKETIQTNPAGKAATGLTEGNKESLYGILIGAIGAVGAYFGNEFLMGGDKNGKNRFERRFIDPIEKTVKNNTALKKIDTFIKDGWTNFKKSSITTKGPIGHFRNHWGDANPRVSPAVAITKSKAGQILDSAFQLSIDKLGAPVSDNIHTLRKSLRKTGMQAPEIEKLLSSPKRNMKEIEKVINGAEKTKAFQFKKLKPKKFEEAKKAINELKNVSLKSKEYRAGLLSNKWNRNKNFHWKKAYKNAIKIYKDSGTPMPKEAEAVMKQFKAASGKSGETVLSKGIRSGFAHADDYLVVHQMKIKGPMGKLMGWGGAIFGAMMIGQTIYKTAKAEKGEKTKTFMEGMLGDVASFAFMEKITAAVYGIMGGLQTIGINSKAPVKALGAPVRGLGKFFGIGLKSSSRLAGFGGGLMRFAIIMGAMSAVGALGVKLSHKIFGKPKATIEAEEKEKAEKAKKKAEKEKAAREKAGIYTPAPNQVQSPFQTVNNKMNTPPLVKEYMNKKKSTGVYPAMAAQNLNKNNTGLEQRGQSSSAPLVEKYMKTGTLGSEPAQKPAASGLKTGQSSYYAVPAPIDGSSVASQKLGASDLETGKTGYYGEPTELSMNDPKKVEELNNLLTRIDKYTQAEAS